MSYHFLGDILQEHYLRFHIKRRDAILIMALLLCLDLANESGQSGSTHAGSGQMGLGKKTSGLKWIAQPMTCTRFFKGRVKTRLTCIFTHEKIYI